MTTDSGHMQAGTEPAAIHRAARVCSKCGRRALTDACAKCGSPAVVKCLACEQPLARCEVLMGEVRQEMARAAEAAKGASAPPATATPIESAEAPHHSPPSAFSIAEGEPLRALTALLVDSLYRSGSTSDAAVVALMRRLLARELDDVALELGVASGRLHERFQKMTPVLTALWNAHFGELGSQYSESPVSAPTRLDPPGLGAPPGTNAPAATSNVVLESIRLSARLRPHARGTLTSWERTLVRQELA